MKKILSILLFASVMGLGGVAQAQQPKIYRVGVITAGGAW